MKPQISIIIPVYNTDRRMFQKCMHSIVNQTCRDFEVIIVDDGSTSGIEKTCDEYAQKYDFITTVHKKNGGLSSARNAGQFIATGEWIMFIDSDDWIDKGTCSGLLKQIEQEPNVDMVVFGFVHHFGDKKKTIKYKHNDGEVLTDRIELVKEALEFPSQFSSSCWKLFKRSFLISKSLSHNETVRQGSEDLEFMVRVLLELRNVLMINQCYYHYIMNQNSITNSFDEKNAYYVQKCFLEIEQILKNTKRKDVLDVFYLRTWYALCAALVGGFFEPHNSLKYNVKKQKAKKYLSTGLSSRTKRMLTPSEIGLSRRMVFYCVKLNLFFPIYCISVFRAIQKKRV